MSVNKLTNLRHKLRFAKLAPAGAGDLNDVVEATGRALRNPNIIEGSKFASNFINTMKLGVAFKKDKLSYGRHMRKETVKIAAGWAAGTAGVFVGQEIGGYVGGGIGLLFGGLAAIPGVAIGKAVGGAAGLLISTSTTSDLIDSVLKD